MKKLLLLAFPFFYTASYAINSISILASESLFENSITSITIKDVQGLLHEACKCPVELNDTKAEILIRLPDFGSSYECPPNPFQQQATVPYYPYPDHNYSWKQFNEADKTILLLKANCWQGVNFGLYGLLQEMLGFSFYHPKETIIPEIKTWPLKSPLDFQGEALFDKKGFHLHTQHPLELTEQLHDPDFPNAIEDIKQYIDWLVRNGQTYFEFCLLESIERKNWIAHANAMVDYAHSRGILAAVDLSLHMIQQKTFQLYRNPFKSFRKKENQITKNLEWLMQADWDVLNMEFATAEFVGGNVEKKEKMRLQILQWLKDNSDAKLMGRKHVVKAESEMMTKGDAWQMDSVQQALDKQRGILIHTVMFYDMTEPSAPVYENENQRHQYDLLLKENKLRETWYYPESAYWITFDNSVPMFLLPYLTARLSDIDTCVKHGIPGHITFSSGWEWGYWLFDWSIARWSWRYTVNGNPQRRDAISPLTRLPISDEITALMQRHLELQQEFLKDKQLIKWLTAMTITDELPFGFNRQFHPSPDVSYKDIRRKISQEQINSIRKKVLPLLDAFSAKTLMLSGKMRPLASAENFSNIKEEWTDGLEITGLRAKHRYYTLSYLLSKREEKLKGEKCNCENLLEKAREVRMEAMKIVMKRESRYRYPVELLARRHYSHTAYPHGYLYSVSNLHFWEREELQARKNNYGAFYKSIWKVGRIIGIID